jgi:hypothetical protein
LIAFWTAAAKAAAFKAAALLPQSKTVALAAALLYVFPVFAADRQRVAAINVGATSLLTYLSCVVQKKVRVATCFGAGAVAGLGFYQAKRMAGRGDVTAAWLTANLATSLVENTTAGEHPLSRIGYTFGPVRFRAATPFDRGGESLLDVDLSAVETGFLVRAVNDADDLDIRDGMLWAETHQRESEGNLIFDGYTWGLYPGVWVHAEEHTRNHETIHAVQALQLDSVEPPAYTFTRHRRAVRVRYLRLGAVNLADNLYHGSRPYEDRWGEIEAYRLTEDRTPPRSQPR